jgi:hypothetical protein
MKMSFSDHNGIKQEINRKKTENVQICGYQTTHS